MCVFVNNVSVFYCIPTNTTFDNVHQASALSEFGTEQLEYIKLSALTGVEVYAARAEHSIKYLHDKFPGMACVAKVCGASAHHCMFTGQGLMPCFINPTMGKVVREHYSVGAMGDSYYEYLLKVVGGENKGGNAC